MHCVKNRSTSFISVVKSRDSGTVKEQKMVEFEPQHFCNYKSNQHCHFVLVTLFAIKRGKKNVKERDALHECISPFIIVYILAA